jgi:OPA family glycerol-3-phosphate transporter-like MFS transporter/OPA family sugar phosphate sensor protein UhpC-like MFS transporter
MTPGQKQKFKHWQIRTLAGTMFGYALFYFVRKNFSFAMPGIEADLGVTKTQLGAFLTLNGLIYGVSQLTNGMFADRKNARWYMSIGLFLCASVNIIFGFGEDVSTFLAGSRDGLRFANIIVYFLGMMWVLNGILQGSGFPPCARLLTHWIPPKELATKMSVWNTSHSVGAGLVVIMCGYIMGNMGEGPGHVGAWRWCFWIPGMIALAGSAALFMVLRDTPSSVGLPELEGTEVRKSVTKEEQSAETKLLIRKKVFGNPVMWVLAFANFFVYIVRFAVLDWGPFLLSDSKGVSFTHAGWLVAMFEAAGIAGMLFAGYATDKWLGGRAHRTCVFCMLGAAVFMTIFWLIEPGVPVWIYYATLCAAGFCIYGPQALIGIAAANQATKKAAATANGFKSMFGYASTTISGVGFGYIAQHYGWNYTYLALIIASFIGMGILMLMWNTKADGYGDLERIENAGNGEKR